MSWTKLAQHLIKGGKGIDLIAASQEPPKQIDELVSAFEKLWEGEHNFRTGMILGIMIAEMLNEGKD